MKPNEVVENYDEQLDKYTSYVDDRIHKVVGDIGSRESGSESEHKAQDFVAEDMKDIADDIKKEPFSLHPKAFMGWVTCDGAIIMVNAILLILTLFGVFNSTALNIIMLVASVFCLVFMFFEFLLYKQFMDPVFPKKDTYNVVCKREASGEVKRRIILGGHVDSAYEWYFTYLGGGHCMVFAAAYAIIMMVVTFVMDILLLCGVGVNPGAMHVIMLVLAFVTLPAMVLALMFVHWKLVVPGANDNLTGVFAAMSVMRFLKENDIRFEHTEVESISFACEEAGLRGAKAFAKKHSAEFAAEDGVETIAIDIDTLRDYNDMGVYNRDMTGTVHLDPDATAVLKKGTEEAGLDLPYLNVFFGSSDAAALVQGGMKAVLLAAMDPTPARYYHTRLDTPDNLDPKTIRADVDSLIRSVFIFDEEGIPGKE